MPYSDREYYMWLTLAFGPANPRKWVALSHYGSIAEAYEKISGGDMTHVLPKDLGSVRSAKMSQAQKLLAFCEDKKISVCAYCDEGFPNRLKEIYNPPSVLFYIGDISGIDTDIVISAVGTRKPSEYSVAAAQRICADLASKGVIIASGFAVGLDSVAHRAALLAGGKTYAVLPCGILYDFPKENASRKRVVAKRGAVISEYFPSDKPDSLSFRARNRLLSGIGLGTLVLQAGRKSGALSTASFALSQGRDIFCIPPHDIFDEAYDGVVGLIRDGAISVFDAEDILNEYNGLYPHKLKSEKAVIKPMPEGGERKPIEKPAADKQPRQSQTKKQQRREHFAEPYIEGLYGSKKQIYDLIRESGEIHLDGLSVGTGDPSELEAVLTELELDGLIVSLPGNRFGIRRTSD